MRTCKEIQESKRIIEASQALSEENRTKKLLAEWNTEEFQDRLKRLKKSRCPAKSKKARDKASKTSNSKAAVQPISGHESQAGGDADAHGHFRVTSKGQDTRDNSLINVTEAPHFTAQGTPPQSQNLNASTSPDFNALAEQGCTSNEYPTLSEEKVETKDSGHSTGLKLEAFHLSNKGTLIPNKFQRAILKEKGTKHLAQDEIDNDGDDAIWQNLNEVQGTQEASEKLNYSNRVRIQLLKQWDSQLCQEMDCYKDLRYIEPQQSGSSLTTDMGKDCVSPVREPEGTPEDKGSNSIHPANQLLQLPAQYEGNDTTSIGLCGHGTRSDAGRLEVSTSIRDHRQTLTGTNVSPSCVSTSGRSNKRLRMDSAGRERSSIITKESVHPLENLTHDEDMTEVRPDCKGKNNNDRGKSPELRYRPVLESIPSRNPSGRNGGKLIMDPPKVVRTHGLRDGDVKRTIRLPQQSSKVIPKPIIVGTDEVAGIREKEPPGGDGELSGGMRKKSSEGVRVSSVNGGEPNEADVCGLRKSLGGDRRSRGQESESVKVNGTSFGGITEARSHTRKTEMFREDIESFKGSTRPFGEEGASSLRAGESFDGDIESKFRGERESSKGRRQSFGGDRESSGGKGKSREEERDSILGTGNTSVGAGREPSTFPGDNPFRGDRGLRGENRKTSRKDKELSFPVRKATGSDKESFPYCPINCEDDSSRPVAVTPDVSGDGNSDSKVSVSTGKDIVTNDIFSLSHARDSTSVGLSHSIDSTIVGLTHERDSISVGLSHEKDSTIVGLTHVRDSNSVGLSHEKDSTIVCLSHAKDSTRDEDMLESTQILNFNESSYRLVQGRQEDTPLTCASTPYTSRSSATLGDQVDSCRPLTLDYHDQLDTSRSATCCNQLDKRRSMTHDDHHDTSGPIATDNQPDTSRHRTCDISQPEAGISPLCDYQPDMEGSHFCDYQPASGINQPNRGTLPRCKNVLHQAKKQNLAESFTTLQCNNSNGAATSDTPTNSSKTETNFRDETLIEDDISVNQSVGLASLPNSSNFSCTANVRSSPPLPVGATMNRCSPTREAAIGQGKGEGVSSHDGRPMPRSALSRGHNCSPLSDLSDTPHPVATQRGSRCSRTIVNGYSTREPPAIENQYCGGEDKINYKDLQKRVHEFNKQAFIRRVKKPIKSDGFDTSLQRSHKASRHLESDNSSTTMGKGENKNTSTGESESDLPCWLSGSSLKVSAKPAFNARKYKPNVRLRTMQHVKEKHSHRKHEHLVRETHHAENAMKPADCSDLASSKPRTQKPSVQSNDSLGAWGSCSQTTAGQPWAKTDSKRRAFDIEPKPNVLLGKKKKTMRMLKKLTVNEEKIEKDLSSVSTKGKQSLPLGNETRPGSNQSRSSHQEVHSGIRISDTVKDAEKWDRNSPFSEEDLSQTNVIYSSTADYRLSEEGETGEHLGNELLPTGSGADTPVCDTVAYNRAETPLRSMGTPNQPNSSPSSLTDMVSQDESRSTPSDPSQSQDRWQRWSKDCNEQLSGEDEDGAEAQCYRTLISTAISNARANTDKFRGIWSSTKTAKASDGKSTTNRGRQSQVSPSEVSHGLHLPAIPKEKINGKNFVWNGHDTEEGNCNNSCLETNMDNTDKDHTDRDNMDTDETGIKGFGAEDWNGMEEKFKLDSFEMCTAYSRRGVYSSSAITTNVSTALKTHPMRSKTIKKSKIPISIKRRQLRKSNRENWPLSILGKNDNGCLAERSLCTFTSPTTAGPDYQSLGRSDRNSNQSQVSQSSLESTDNREHNTLGYSMGPYRIPDPCQRRRSDSCEIVLSQKEITENMLLQSEGREYESASNKRIEIMTVTDESPEPIPSLKENVWTPDNVIDGHRTPELSPSTIETPECLSSASEISGHMIKVATNTQGCTPSVHSKAEYVSSPHETLGATNGYHDTDDFEKQAWRASHADCQETGSMASFSVTNFSADRDVCCDEEETAIDTSMDRSYSPSLNIIGCEQLREFIPEQCQSKCSITAISKSSPPHSSLSIMPLSRMSTACDWRKGEETIATKTKHQLNDEEPDPYYLQIIHQKIVNFFHKTRYSLDFPQLNIANNLQWSASVQSFGHPFCSSVSTEFAGRSRRPSPEQTGNASQTLTVQDATEFSYSINILDETQYGTSTNFFLPLSQHPPCPKPRIFLNGRRRPKSPLVSNACSTACSLTSKSWPRPKWSNCSPQRSKRPKSKLKLAQRLSLGSYGTRALQQVTPRVSRNVQEGNTECQWFKRISPGPNMDAEGRNNSCKDGRCTNNASTSNGSQSMSGRNTKTENVYPPTGAHEEMDTGEGTSRRCICIYRGGKKQVRFKRGTLKFCNQSPLLLPAAYGSMNGHESNSPSDRNESNCPMQTDYLKEIRELDSPPTARRSNSPKGFHRSNSLNRLDISTNNYQSNCPTDIHELNNSSDIHESYSPKDVSASDIPPDIHQVGSPASTRKSQSRPDGLLNIYRSDTPMDIDTSARGGLLVNDASINNFGNSYQEDIFDDDYNGRKNDKMVAYSLPNRSNPNAAVEDDWDKEDERISVDSLGSDVATTRIVRTSGDSANEGVTWMKAVKCEVGGSKTFNKRKDCPLPPLCKRQIGHPHRSNTWKRHY